jgi:hypothetical protein
MIGQSTFLLPVPNFDYKLPVKYQMHYLALVQDAECSDGHLLRKSMARYQFSKLHQPAVPVLRPMLCRPIAMPKAILVSMVMAIIIVLKTTLKSMRRIA